MFNILKYVIRNSNQIIPLFSNRPKIVTRLYNVKQNYSLNFKYVTYAGILTWLGFVKEDENKESELIMTIKRSILLMQREELPKAEKMLHIALKLAQEQQNSQGILYVYDLMANLALEREEADKAEVLFVNVLQRLLSGGLEEDDLKVIHISLKLARIYQLKHEQDKANIGFNWCLDKIQKHLSSENKDALILSGIIKDWYAQFLLEKGEVNESIKYLRDAHTISTEVNGPDSEKSVLLLNDLGTACWRNGDLESAKNYLTTAVVLGRKLEDFKYLGVLYANLGLICLQRGFVIEAQRYCKEGFMIGRKLKSEDAMEQANYCFEQIKINS